MENIFVKISVTILHISIHDVMCRDMQDGDIGNENDSSCAGFSNLTNKSKFYHNKQLGK